MYPLLTSLLLGLLVSCSNAPQTVTKADPWATTSKPPRRLLFLMLPPVSLEELNSASLSHFSLLREKSLVLSHATVGHLPVSPFISRQVMSTGFFPKHLPITTPTFRDTRGRFAKKDTLVRLSTLPPSKLEDLRLSTTTLLQLFEQLQRPQLLVVDTPTLAQAFQPAEIIDLTTVIEPHSVSKPILRFWNENPDWSAVFASFPTSSPFDLEKWNEDVGVLLKNLSENDQLKETLIVLTADGGYVPPTKEPASITKKGCPLSLEVICKDSDVIGMDIGGAVFLFLKKIGRHEQMQLTSKIRSIPSVADIYLRQTTEGRQHYIRTYRNPDLTPEDLEWAKAHYPTLVETLSNETSPDIVLLLKEGAQYASKEPLGGAQASQQKIPFWIYAPNLNFRDSLAVETAANADVRLVDTLPIISKIMALPLAEKDGSGSAINALIQEHL